ncbi:MAG: hypothetical protein K6F77_00555 [Lachnospiraceae bacterium]|nr:hypothetical protein [Lachnospiraceae bacterium]
MHTVSNTLSNRIKKVTRDNSNFKFQNFKNYISNKYEFEELYKLVKDQNVIDKRTMKKWYSDDTFSVPSRYQILKVCVALSLSIDEAEDFLINGIQSYSFQINDYQEFIYMYAISNSLTYDESAEMVAFFETMLTEDIQFSQSSDTFKLKEIFELHKHDSKENFLKVMIKNMPLFKGYSLSVLNTFKSLMDDIFVYIQQDSEDELKLDLQSTNFDEWKLTTKRNEGETDLQYIERYIHSASRSKKSNVPDKDTLKQISWLAHKAYAAKNKNTNLIKELYSIPPMNLPFDKSLLTDKTLSELLSIGEQKQILVSMKIGLKEAIDGIDEEAIKEYKKKFKSQKQRVHNIQRNDLLPMIHYIATRKYLQQCSDEDTSYNEKAAVKFFEAYANTILDKCQMAHINKAYVMDYILISCFTKDEIYSFADAIEVLQYTYNSF